MRNFLSVFLVLLFSPLVSADELRSGDKPQVAYDKVLVLDVASAKATGKLVSDKFQAKLKLILLVDGNLCGKNKSSFGQYVVESGDLITVSLFAGAPVTEEARECEEFANEIKVPVTVSFELEKKKSRTFSIDGNRVTVTDVKGTLVTKVEPGMGND